MMRKKGFTLIELLAVIVVLSIIALIAIPLILNIISKVEKGALKGSAYGMIDAAKLYYTTSILNGGYKGGTFDFEGSTKDFFKVSGAKPDSGTLQIDSVGNMKGKLVYGKYTFYICNGRVEDTDIASSCVLGEIPSVPEEVVYPKYDQGTAIYFNPETNLLCSEGESLSFNGIKTGCMKWYIFNDYESSSTVDMILDHNTTSAVAWNSSGNTQDGMGEVAHALANDTLSWHPTVQSTVRLISADEIAKITGNTGFNQATSNADQWFFFHDNTQNEVNLLQGMNSYKWLFNGTTGCITYGCDVEGIHSYGYWTTSPTIGNSDHVWYVNRKGLLYSYYANYGSDYGVRPVITIPKSIFQNNIPQPVTYKKYDQGTAIYFNPETNLLCNENEVVSSTGTKTGCMRWYVFNDHEGSGMVHMILDHNTTVAVAWNSSGNTQNGMREVAHALMNDISTWSDEVKPTARLIEADDIAKITGNTSFKQATSNVDQWFFFNDNTQNEVHLPEGMNSYKWLFNDTIGCSAYGCDVEGIHSYGYWTTSPTIGSSNHVWYVNRKGLLYSYYANYGSDYGVRPVITISKSILGAY